MWVSRRNFAKARLLLGMMAITLGLTPSCGRCDDDSTGRRNLERLGAAALDYKDIHGRFPPCFVFDEDGRPMHSWRVLLLPFVEANAFTENYDSADAWNGPSNADLADGSRRTESSKFPDPANVRQVYQRLPGASSPANLTTDYLAVALDKETLVPYKGAPPSLGGADRMAWASPEQDEFIIVQVNGSGVHWMEPRDIVLTTPVPAWGIPFRRIKDKLEAAVVVSGGNVTFHDRNATLTLLTGRMSRMKAITADTSVR